MARAVMCGHPRKGRRGEIGRPGRTFWGSQVGERQQHGGCPPPAPFLRNPDSKGEEGPLLGGVFISLPFGS